MAHTESKYIIRGYCSDTEGGYDSETVADTLKEAKQRARHMMSDEYTRIVESTVPVVYVTVQRSDSDDIVLDFGEPV